MDYRGADGEGQTQRTLRREQRSLIRLLSRDVPVSTNSGDKTQRPRHIGEAFEVHRKKNQWPAGALCVAAGRAVVPCGAGAEGAEAAAGCSGAGMPDLVL
jgi:hypothetical protein